MAQGLQNTSNMEEHTFDKNIVRDVNDFHLPKNVWGHARNAINNSKTGDLGKIGNEPANDLCTELVNSLVPLASALPYSVIGVIHLEADKWAIFSTNGVSSEIGLFVEGLCKYSTVVNDDCLGFKLEFLIKGVSRATSNCVFEVYWDDSFNNSRFITFDIDDPSVNVYTNPNSPIPWIQNCVPAVPTPNVCTICTNTNRLNCDLIRVAKLIDLPCVSIKKGVAGGTLLNGSYFIATAYAISGQKVSDYTISNVQPLFEHSNGACSIDVDILSVDRRFDDLMVVIVSIVNQQTVARLAGIYSTSQVRLSFDIISNEWPTVPLEQIPIMTPIPNKTDEMYNAGAYLIRVGPTSKEDFNYQPFANQIVAKWVSVEYDAKYYRNGGNNVGYLRDEVYPFVIRYIYDTGDKSSSYHIPGRPPVNNYSGFGPEDGPFVNPDSLPGDALLFQTYNTAVQVPTPVATLPDGGVVIAKGYMGYWESSEKYPDEKPEIWNPSFPGHPWTAVPANTPYTPLDNTLTPADYDLCNKPIRHHKFPEDGLSAQTLLFNAGVGDKIRIMGVEFSNVLPPRDNTGALIPNITGYEILRGSRNGNMTIIAKGIINNMGLYDINSPTGGTQQVGAYANYPYNDLGLDPFLSTTQTKNQFSLLGVSVGGTNYNPPGPIAPSVTTGPANMSAIYHTFHSPDTNFTNPFLDAKEMKVYGNVYGEVKNAKFEYSEKHPKEKLLTNLSFLVGAVGGVGLAAIAANGKRRVSYKAPESPGYSTQSRTGVITDLKTSVGTPLTNLDTIVVPFPIGTTPGPLVFGPGVVNKTISLVNAGTATELPGPPGGIGSSPTLLDIPLIIAAKTATGTANTTLETALDAGGLLGANVLGQTTDVLYGPLSAAYVTSSLTSNALTDAGRRYDLEDGTFNNIPLPFRVLGGIPLFSNYFTQGTDTIIELIRSMLRYQNFVLRYESHGFYNNFVPSTLVGTRRRTVTDEQYMGPQRVEFGSGTTKITINNVLRVNAVALELGAPLAGPAITDKTRYKVTDVNTVAPGYNDFRRDPTSQFVTRDSLLGSGDQTASSHYVALKQRIVNQYGQLIDIKQQPIPGCITKTPLPEVSKTAVLFGGDTYIGRYTEKNTFFYFNDWLYGQPDGAQLDYNSARMFAGLYPRFWANFNQFQTSDFTSSILPAITPPFNVPGGLVTPSDFYALDFDPSFTAAFNPGAKNSWMYLFNSGVRDFFVESEINIDLRDWGNVEEERHYDPYNYTNLKQIFDTATIRTGNYYKYDFSLSVSKLFINYVSWASMQTRQYSPYLAETCYVYRPRRVIYSLPAQFEGRRDNWLIFLPNNYYDFLSRVTCIKSINKSGAIIFFENASPVEFQGTDQLQTGLGTKLTIGDGGLFTQPLQAVTNADNSYEHGSCQNRLSVINTPAGLFWISQNQGKIFTMAQGGIKAISDSDLKWWFTNYLPYKLTEFFPNFQLTDNPVIGIGCQSVYDNENGLAYFCKKDYTLRPEYTPKLTPNGPGNVEYLGGNRFRHSTGLIFLLGDPQFFENASWTVSYDPKIGGWLGWHDWHPELLMPGKNTFMSIITNAATKAAGIWIHNERCDLYCNYYGKDYPFEIEYMVNTPQQVTTLRSIEYYMEVYKYDQNCYDRFHVLDYNFDDAVIYNTEQCSGLLRLNNNPQDNPTAIIAYPIIQPTFIDILYSKVENKYRFNQFWDTTNDRGEYPLYPLPPVSQQMIWNTEPNGYIKSLNANNLNYNKPELQRKKFRHYTTSVFLRKRVTPEQMRYKILVMITENKQLYSPR
jgi:hypothetical protein